MAAGFYIYETTTLTLTIEDAQGQPMPEALADYEAIVVSLYQAGTKQLDFTADVLGIDAENATVSVPLTQRQTGAFKPGTAKVQLNIKYTNTERDVTTTATVTVLDNLYKKVI